MIKIGNLILRTVMFEDFNNSPYFEKIWTFI